ncbi:YwaF family protein [Filifactor alocis]
MLQHIVDVLYFSGGEFHTFSTSHCVMLGLIALIVILLLLSKKVGFSDSKNILRYSFIVALMLQQFMLYSWYMLNQQFSIHDSLPLYPCRIWQIVALLLLVTKKDHFFSISYLMGIPCAMVALLGPDVSGVGFPNVMFIQFFIGHGLLIIVPTYMYACHGKRLNEKSFLVALKMFLYYVITVKIVNRILDANYGYVNYPPYNNEFFAKIAPVYPFLYISFSLLVLIGWYKFAVRNNEEVTSSVKEILSSIRS